MSKHDKPVQEPPQDHFRDVTKKVQEPFGYLWPTGRHPEFRFTQQKRDGVDGMPLYAAPPQRPAEPVQEPVAWIDDSGHPKHLSHLQSATERRLYGPLRPLYTTPPPAEPVQEPQCNPHPKAPHGFLRNASHNEDRYVCECEGWEPYEAGYQAGVEAALRAQS